MLQALMISSLVVYTASFSLLIRSPLSLQTRNAASMCSQVISQCSGWIGMFLWRLTMSGPLQWFGPPKRKVRNSTIVECSLGMSLTFSRKKQLTLSSLSTYWQNWATIFSNLSWPPSSSNRLGIFRIFYEQLSNGQKSQPFYSHQQYQQSSSQITQPLLTPQIISSLNDVIYNPCGCQVAGCWGVSVNGSVDVGGVVLLAGGVIVLIQWCTNNNMISQGWPRQKQYIDVKDRDNNWIVGLVLAKNQHQLKVRLDGWSSRYDETLPIPTQPSRQTKIQPFRTHSRGYTGNRRNLSPREHWKFTNQDMEVRLNKLQEFILRRKEKRGEEVTQFLRGQHFFYIDFLLNTIHPQQQDFTCIYQYFKVHIEFANQYIQEILASGVKQWLGFLAKGNQDWQAVYSNCYFQTFETLFNIAGKNERLCFERHNEKAIKQIVGHFQTHQNYISNELMVSGAFESIKKLIVQTNRTESEVPILFVYSLFELFFSIEKTLVLEKDPDLNTLLSAMCSIIARSFGGVSGEDLKNGLDKQMEEILLQIKFICGKYHCNDLVGDWLEELKIKYFIMFISSSNIERKFKGLFKLREYVQKKDYLWRNATVAGALKGARLEELLFESNEHGQFFKKSLELVLYLYQYRVIGIQVLVYVWSRAFNKEANILKILYDFCLKFVPLVGKEDISPFFEFLEAIRRYFVDNRENPEIVQFYFEFLQCVTKASWGEHMQAEETIHLCILTMFQFALGDGPAVLPPQLVVGFSKIVLQASLYKSFIEQLFSRLTQATHCNVAALILYHVYLYMEEKNFFVPLHYPLTILNALKTIKLTSGQTKNVIDLLNRILVAVEDYNDQYVLTPQQFKQFWQLFQAMPEAKRNLFYDWLMEGNSKNAEPSSINQVIYPQLKRYILVEILKEENFADFQNITTRQFEMIIEFYLEINQFYHKLQLKHYGPDHKVYRLKQIETIKESLLWSVFQKCKDTQVISMLNRHLIPLHFYYAPQIGPSLRKGRVDELISKIKGFLDSALEGENRGLAKHALMLLKKVIDLIKQQKSESDESQPLIKVHILLENRTSSLQVYYQDTIGNIRHRIASLRKVAPAHIKMLNSKNEQLSYDVNNIPICCFPEKYFKVVEIPKEEETMSKFVLSLLSESMEEVLFNMLGVEETVQEVYQLLNELQVKQGKEVVLQRVSKMIARLQKVDESTCKSIHYYYLIQVKVYNKHSQDHQFIESALATPSFTRLLSVLNCPITLEAHLQLLLALTNFLVVVVQKGIPFQCRVDVASRCLGMIQQIYLLGQRQKVRSGLMSTLIKVVHNANFFLESVIGGSKMLGFIIENKRHELLGMSYFCPSLEVLKIIVIERVKKCMAMYKAQAEKDLPLESALIQLYSFFNSQMMQTFIANQLTHPTLKAELFTTLSRLIEALSPPTLEAHVNSPEGLYYFASGFIKQLIQHKKFRYLEGLSVIVVGQLVILKSIIERRPYLNSPEAIGFIINRCLINDNLSQPSICGTPQAIKAAFEIIQSILKRSNTPSLFRMVIKGFEGVQKIMLWRHSNKWSIKPYSLQSKKPHYRGLVNPGCICYMNSLLQQLFAIQEFKMGILSTNTRWMEGSEGEQAAKEQPTILQAMKELFLKLTYSHESVINPVPFSRTIKNPQKKPIIKINEQMDIDQFQAILFEKLQRQLELVGGANIIGELFEGVYLNQIVSLECSHRSQRQESFISMSLQVKKNIYECFKSFVKVDRLDGENKYFCQLCDRKVKAERIQSIKKLPPYLILSLKRFEFNFETLAKIKINHYCEFYTQLNLKEFSTQELSRNLIVPEGNQTHEVYPDEFFNYKLRGVVIHSGCADSGHYYSLIETKSGRWLQFNDDEVCPFDFSKLPEEAFGNRYPEEDKTRNAYLLIYEREGVRQAREHEGAREAQSKMHGEGLQEEKILGVHENKKIVSHIFEKNSELQKYSLVFSQPYEQFIEFLHQHQEEFSLTSIEQEWYDFFFSYYFLVLIRKDSFDQFISFTKRLENTLTHNARVRQKYLRLFTSCNFIDEFYVCSSSKERSRVLSHLFSTALIQYINDSLSVPLQENQLFNQVLLVIKMSLIHCGQLYELSMGLRRVLEYLAVNLQHHLQYIVLNYSFENIYIDILFSNAILPKQKEQFTHMYLSNKKNVTFSFIPPTNTHDRRFHISQPAESWAILSTLLKEASQMGSEEGNEVLQANLMFLANVVSSALASKSQSMVYSCGSERGVHHLYLTYKYLKLGKQLCEILEGGLRDFQSLKFRPFMLLITAILRDTSREIDLKTVVDILHRTHKHNTKYFLEVDLINQWMVRFMAISEEFLREFESRADFIEEALCWVERTTGPTQQNLKKHKVPQGDRYLDRHYGILISADPNEYKDNQRILKKVFESVLDSTFKLRAALPPVDQPMTPGKNVKYYDLVLGKWMEYGCSIVSNNFGYMVVSVGKDCVCLWEDSEKVKVRSNEFEFCMLRDSWEEENSSLSYEESEQEAS